MDEKFKDIIHDKMYSFEVEPDAGDWLAIEQKLTGLKPGKKRISMKRYISAAAVAALFVISGFAFYFIQKQDNLVVDNHDKKEGKSIIEPVKTDIKDADTVVSTPFIEPIDDEIILPLKSNNQEKIVVNRGAKENNDLVEKLPNDLPENKNLIADIDSHIIDNTIQTSTDNNVVEGGIKPENEITNNSDEVKPDEDSYIPLRDNFEEDLTIHEGKNKKEENLSIGLSFSSGNTSESSSQVSNMMNSPMLNDYSTIKQSVAPANSISSTADHNYPLSFGLSVRKNLNKRFAVETGLVYTYLRSTSNLSHSKNIQNLHYIGIPVKGIFNVVNFGGFSVYLSAGGMAEKNISGRYIVNYGKGNSSTNNITTSRLQWSVSASGGLNYKIFRGLGLYIEPGWAYYFDDKSGLNSYRSKNRSMFSFQAGFRFAF